MKTYIGVVNVAALIALQQKGFQIPSFLDQSHPTRDSSLGKGGVIVRIIEAKGEGEAKAKLMQAFGIDCSGILACTFVTVMEYSQIENLY